MFKPFAFIKCRLSLHHDNLIWLIALLLFVDSFRRVGTFSVVNEECISHRVSVVDIWCVHGSERNQQQYKKYLYHRQQFTCSLLRFDSASSNKPTDYYLIIIMLSQIHQKRDIVLGLLEEIKCGFSWQFLFKWRVPFIRVSVFASLMILSRN